MKTGVFLQAIVGPMDVVTFLPLLVMLVLTQTLAHAHARTECEKAGEIAAESP